MLGEKANSVLLNIKDDDLRNYEKLKALILRDFQRTPQECLNVDEDSKKYTSFVTPDGQYEFNKVPFGLCNSPSTFQRYINYVFRDLLREGVVVILMDDIFIPAEGEIDALNRGTAFTSTDFKTFCQDEGIEHVKITTGILRGNGQVEIMHNNLIPILAKLSIKDPTKWYKFVPAVQRTINSTVSRSTQMTPFQLLTGVKMKTKEH
ncbi:uncharacterized protein [Parasteatoda tepidariorum]|uniref:uncharacterized protein n=1 Tax=Parasteatoda tepidariorum TaxID=114398 RepID=UPI0039BC3B42